MPAFDPSDFGVVELGALMTSGEVAAVDLTRHYLERIDALDPKVNAVLEVNREAPDLAAAMDAERSAGRCRGPLHGIPILIKDNIDTADTMTTTAGSVALEGSRPARDAIVVERLRAAGAVILGKTNLSEWANFRSTHSSSGWSSRGGQTRNPYALDRSPGGSSSGSGAAVAAGFCAAAIGTETDGSIMSPSAMNGIVGIKPTVGLVGRSGIVPIAHSQDTAGPMAPCVADAAVLLTAIAGSDSDDSLTQEADERRAADYTAFLNDEGLRGVRIGAVNALADFHVGVAGIFEESLAAMRRAGAIVIDDVKVVPAAEVRPHEKLVMTTEFKQGLNTYLAGRGSDGKVRSLADVIAFNQTHRDRMMPYFQQELLEQSQKTGATSSPEYRHARAECLRLMREESIDKALQEHRLDAIVAPTTCAPWLIDWVGGDNRSGGSAYLAAIAGYPSVSVPAGYLFGLPIGISFVASAWQEPALIRMAYAFEKATAIRRRPEFLTMASF